MNVFLSYAVAPFDTPIAARLRAVAATSDISILLPDRTQLVHNGLPPDTQAKIKSSDAIIALVTANAPLDLVGLVNAELLAAAESSVPVIALIEQGVHLEAPPATHVVYFDRLWQAHEEQLVAALSSIRQQKQWKQNLSALGWIAVTTLGLIALSELASDQE